MTKHTLSCRNCNHPYDVYLPEEANGISYKKCDRPDNRIHGLKQKTECENCGEPNIIYYCTDGHPALVSSQN